MFRRAKRLRSDYGKEEETMKGLIVKSAWLAAAGVVAVGLAASSALAEDGKKLYDTTCASCHGAGGKGDGPMGQHLQPKPGDFATALKGKDDAYIRKAVEGGGAAVGKSAMMPAYKGTLSEEQIQALIEHLKGFVA